MENMGGVYFVTKRYKETLAVLGDVLALRRKVLGNEHTAVTRTLLNTATVATSAGDLAAADRAYAESVPRFRRELGADHPDVATTLVNWSITTWRLKDWARTEKLGREALDIRLRRKISRPAVAEAQIAVARALVGQKRYDEAEPLLLEARKTRLDAGMAAGDKVVGFANEELAKIARARAAASK